MEPSLQPEQPKFAVDLTSERDPNRARQVRNLGVLLLKLFVIEGKLDDSNQAIEYGHDAVNMTPEENP